MKLTTSMLKNMIKEQLQSVINEGEADSMSIGGTSEVPNAGRLIRDIKEKFVGFNAIGDTFLDGDTSYIRVELNRPQLDWLLSKLGTGDTVDSLISAERGSRGLGKSRYSTK